jgi:hypothetical protein
LLVLPTIEADNYGDFDRGVDVNATEVNDRLARLVEDRVAAAIAAGEELRDLRSNLFPSDRDDKSVEVAKLVRGEFEQWVRDAEQTYARASRLKQTGREVPAIEELANLIGSAKAMLQITLADHFEALDQLARGETVSMEELRRELQLKRGA